MGKISIYNVNDTPIGKGGMGQVYLGTDPQGNRVAIKEMRAQYVTDAIVRRRVKQDYELLGQFNHQSIVKLYGAFEERGNLYIVMEYVEGETLEQYVRQHGTIAESEATCLLCQILSALEYVHKQDIVHRDIKPSNIMIRSNGDICLIDFGIAKNLNLGKNGITVGQFAIGTTGYMSPEQAEGLSIDHRSDIYSLGCVLFYMLTGRHAIEKQTNDLATKLTIIQSAFPKAKDYNPNISDNIQRILDKATHKNMLQRFQSCREFEMEIRGGATNITSNSNNENTISVGRENCDIIIAPHSLKVSRHHLDITFFNHTGNTGYILLDRSSNGTTVGKQFIHNNQVVTSWCAGGKWEKPTILLADEVELKWEDIEAAFAQKQHTTKPSVAATPPTPKPTPLPTAEQGESATGWLVAISIFAILGGLLGLILGISLYQQKITLPNGKKIPKYKQSHRTAALIGAILSGISLIIWKTTI